MRISVTIGRNVGHEPMDTRDWLRFQQAVTDRMFVNPYPTITYQAGEWEGVAEESATITGETRTFDPLVWAQIAMQFQQDAIAILIDEAPRWVLVFPGGGSALGWEA